MIEVAIEKNVGGIRGSISPAEAAPAVYALVGTDIFGASSAGQDGSFLIDGLPSGIYEIILMPDTDFPEVSLKGVQVQEGITEIGRIQIAS